MLSTTSEAVNAVLKADPALTPAERVRIMALIRNHGRKPEPATPPAPGKQVLTRDDVARRFNRSKRFVDGLGKAGILRRVKLPGRTRACGYLAEEVERVMSGEAVQQ